MGLKEKTIKLIKGIQKLYKKIYKDNKEKNGIKLAKIIKKERNKKIIKINTYKIAYYNTTAMERKILSEIMEIN